MIALFAAMEAEIAACPGWTREGEAKAFQGFSLIESAGAIVCQTGIGREKAQQASDLALSRFSPAAVLSVGLAGGLAPGTEVGEVVVCTHVDHESHRHSVAEQSVYADGQLFEMAMEVGDGLDLAVRTGTSLTVDEAAWGPAEKAAHHAWKSHEIVEMESFWIAAAAARRGLPFLAVRSISDSSQDTLPNIGATRDDGTLDREKLIAHLERHPETAELLSAVAQNSRAALANLSTYLEALCERLVGRSSRTSS